MRPSERFLYHCAPVLAGVKSSNTFILYKNEIEDFQSLLSKWDVNYHILYKSAEQEILLIYREVKLRQQLSKEENQSFLQERQYPSWDLDGSLNKLSLHIQGYYDKERYFPHELGCFLDYPVYDIQGFVNNQGKNYLYCGYWKVYEHLDYAKKLFARYDDAKIKIISLKS